MAENKEKNPTPEKEFDEEKFNKMLEEVAKLPPLNGNLISDYDTILLKEAAAVGAVWKEYRDAGVANALIDNHIDQITKMYDSLIQGIEVLVENVKKEKMAQNRKEE
jgi:hypothetical protein